MLNIDEQEENLKVVNDMAASMAKRHTKVFLR